jgi:DNA-binding response OmpR family regulator
MLNTARQIFILDDDQDDLEIVSIAFKETCSNCEVHTADSFKVLHSMLEKLNTPPAAILLDLNMPLLSGIECLRKLRENNNTSGYPVIIFSTFISEKDRFASINLGVNKFIVKPNSFDELKKVAATICDYRMEKNESHKQAFQDI